MRFYTKCSKSNPTLIPAKHQGRDKNDRNGRDSARSWEQFSFLPPNHEFKRRSVLWFNEIYRFESLDRELSRESDLQNKGDAEDVLQHKSIYVRAI